MAILRDTWPLDDDPTQILGYSQSYYPNTPDPSDAQRVKVGLGQEVGAIDIGLVPGRTAKLSGIALSSSGAPIVGQPVSVMQEISGPTMMSMMSVGTAKTAGDGSWSIAKVPAGEYRLQVRDKEETGEMMVAVAGADIDGLVIVVGSGGTLRGTVATDDGSPLVGALERLSVRGRTVNTDLRPRQPTGSAENGRVGKEGAFEFKGAFGPTLLTIPALQSPWSIKTIEYEGNDVADTPIDVKHGETLSGFRVVLTNRPSVVRGMVRDEKSQTVIEGTIVVFAADRT